MEVYAGICWIWIKSGDYRAPTVSGVVNELGIFIVLVCHGFAMQDFVRTYLPAPGNFANLFHSLRSPNWISSKNPLEGYRRAMMQPVFLQAI